MRGWLTTLALVLVAGCGSPTSTPATGSAGPAASGVALPPASGTEPVPSASSSQAGAPTGIAVALEVREWDVPAGTHPHDVAPAADGGIWYTGQHRGVLGHLDPASGTVREIALGDGSSPHGVITGPDEAAWITDSGLDAIVRVDATTEAITVFPLPGSGSTANLNTAVFDPTGTLWFTGQAGIYGRLVPTTGAMDVFQAPGGRGPYGITAAPDGSVWYASLAGSHIARVDPSTDDATVVEPPTAEQGARRVWSDAASRIWVSEWTAGQVAVHDPADGSWQEWRLPGERPQAYAVFVDHADIVWLSDFGANAVVRFDPASEGFSSITLPSNGSAVRQLHGRPGEVWGAASAVDRIVRITGG